jgi:serine/threonine protein phosphatase PrpC
MQVAKHFISVFERVNNALEADKSIDSSLSGTTAVAGTLISLSCPLYTNHVSLLLQTGLVIFRIFTAIVLGRAGNRKIITANAGDSRVMIGYEEVRHIFILFFTSANPHGSCAGRTDEGKGTF